MMSILHHLAVIVDHRAIDPCRYNGVSGLGSGIWSPRTLRLRHFVADGLMATCHPHHIRIIAGGKPAATVYIVYPGGI